MRIFKDQSKVIREIRLPAQKNKLTRVAKNIIYKALEARLSISRALELADISRSTFERWKKKGENPVNREHFLFINKVKEIIADNEKECLRVLEQAQFGGYRIQETKVVVSDKDGRTVTNVTKTLAPNWTAAAWYLERCCKGYELKPYSENTDKSSEEIALDIMQAIREIETSVPEE